MEITYSKTSQSVDMFDKYTPNTCTDKIKEPTSFPSKTISVTSLVGSTAQEPNHYFHVKTPARLSTEVKRRQEHDVTAVYQLCFTSMLKVWRVSVRKSSVVKNMMP